jgi:hypothetical protein
LVEFYELQLGGHATEAEVHAILSNPLASAIPKWQALKLLRGMQNMYQSKHNRKIL